MNLRAGEVVQWLYKRHAERAYYNTSMKSTDIHIDQVSFGYEDHHYRTPIKFGGTANFGLLL